MDADTFKSMVVDYSGVHASLKQHAAAMRDLRKRAKEIQTAILQHMQANNIDECSWDGGRLVRKQAKKTEGLKKEHIEGELRKLLGSEATSEAVDTAVTNMYNRRLTDVHETLAIVSEKDT